MSPLKILLASDLHYCADVAGEAAEAGRLIPPDIHNNKVADRFVWHNTMLYDQGNRLADALVALARREAPDLVILTGDLVNTNLPTNVAGVADRLAALPAPVRLVTGNHDIYTHVEGSALQDAFHPGQHATGMRHEWVGDLGLIYLDIFGRGADGQMHKRRSPQPPFSPADYRPADVAAALDLLDSHPDRQFLLFGHYPMLSPAARLQAPGRKIGWEWPTTAPLAARLDRPGNLAGIFCGHQHFVHFQRCAHGFHWTLPPLVEYPCAAALLLVDDHAVQGRVVPVDPAAAAESVAAYGEQWTAGEDQDRDFRFAFAEATS